MLRSILLFGLAFVHLNQVVVDAHDPKLAPKQKKLFEQLAADASDGAESYGTTKWKLHKFGYDLHMNILNNFRYE